MLGPIAGAFLTICVYLGFIVFFFFASYLFAAMVASMIFKYDYKINVHLYICLSFVAIAICLTMIAYVLGGVDWLIDLRNIGVENL